MRDKQDTEELCTLDAETLVTASGGVAGPKIPAHGAPYNSAEARDFRISHGYATH